VKVRLILQPANKRRKIGGRETEAEDKIIETWVVPHTWLTVDGGKGELNSAE